jgi:membrane fusion protein, heavy metal efflux system
MSNPEAPGRGPVAAHDPSPPPARWQGPLLGLLAGVALSGVVFGVVWSKTRGAKAEPAPTFQVDKDAVRLVSSAPLPFKFETALVEVGPPLQRAGVTARVQTVDALTAPSFAPLDGRVLEVAVKIGDHVKEGDHLVMVASGDLASLVREQSAAQLTIKTKESLAQRLQLLVESRAASQNDLMVAQSELNEAKLAATAADARLRSLRVTQAGDSGYWILAARTGTVVQLDAVRGKQVGPDKDKPVATVADLDEVLVVSDVPQKDAAALAVGSPVQITQPGSGADAITGSVELVSDVLDPDRQTVPIRVRVKNPGHALRPNQFVEATFGAAKPEPVVLVASEAVVTDGAKSVVFVQTAPGVLKRREVRVGRQTRDRAEIVSGLAAGDRVVVKGALLLLNAVDSEG